MNLQVPVSFLLLSSKSRIYKCWFLFFLAQEHMSTGIPNFTAPTSTINLSQVILGYAKLIPALLQFWTSININKIIQNCSIPLETGALLTLGECVVNGLWSSWMLSIQANMDSDPSPTFTHQEITGKPPQSKSTRGVPGTRMSVFHVHLLASH